MQALHLPKVVRCEERTGTSAEPGGETMRTRKRVSMPSGWMSRMMMRMMLPVSDGECSGSGAERKGAGRVTHFPPALPRRRRRPGDATKKLRRTLRRPGPDPGPQAPAQPVPRGHRSTANPPSPGPVPLQLLLFLLCLLLHTVRKAMPDITCHCLTLLASRGPSLSTGPLGGLPAPLLPPPLAPWRNDIRRR